MLAYKPSHRKENKRDWRDIYAKAGTIFRNSYKFVRDRVGYILAFAAWVFIIQVGLGICQTNVVNGTIHDPQGNPYANGNASAFLAVVSGQTQPPSTNVTTNGAGFFTMTLTTGSYSFTICAAPSQLPPVNPVANPTPRQVCFQSAPISISSNPQDVSAALNAIAPSLGPQGSQSGGSQTLSSLNNIIFVDGVTNLTLASAVVKCPTYCEIFDTVPEIFSADPFASATGKNIEVHFGPGVWTIASGGTYGMTVPSNTSLLCGSQATTIKVGNATNYVNDIVLGGYASINTVNNARIDNCTIDGNAANNLGGVTNAVILVAGGFPVNGQPGGGNHITRNHFLTSPGQFLMVSDALVSSVYYPSVGDEIGENVWDVQNGCGQHCIMIYGHSATGGEFFNTRVHDNRISAAQGFGHEIRVANGVITTGNQVTGIVCCGGQATVNTTNSAITGCASNGVTFTAGTTANLVGSDTMGSGSQLKINRVTYTVSHVVDGTHVCISTPPGTQTGVAAYGGSLELIHHDTAAFGLTADNILDTGSDNCMSFINQTGGQAAQGYRIVGNSIRNCGGLGINLDGTTGTVNITLNDISANTVNGAGQGGAAEAVQFDSGIRLASVKDINNSIQGNWIGDTAGSPTMAYAIALDTVGTGNYPGFNFYGPTVTGQVRGTGNSNALSVLVNANCLESFQGTGTGPYCLIQGLAGGGVQVSDVPARAIQLPSGPQATGTGAGLTGTGACATGSLTTQTGGSWGGSVKCTGATAASTLVISPGITEPNGWNCKASYDSTTQANVPTLTFNTTTCTLTFTTVTQNDVIVFSALPF